MSGRVREGDDGTISYADGGWGTLHCCVCSCAVGKADPLARGWGWFNGTPIHDGACRNRLAGRDVPAREHETLHRRLDYCRIMLYVHGLLTDRERERVMVRLDKRYPRTTPESEAPSGSREDG